MKKLIKYFDDVVKKANDVLGFLDHKNHPLSIDDETGTTWCEKCDVRVCWKCKIEIDNELISCANHDFTE